MTELSIGNLLYPAVGSLPDPTYINDLTAKVVEHRTGTNRIASYFHDGTGVDWTTTSAKKVAIDITKFQVQLTTRGNPVLVLFFGSVKSSETNGYSEYSIERETLINGVWVSDPVDNRNAAMQPHTASNYLPITLIKPYPFYGVGTYRWTVFWGVGIGLSGTLTLQATTKPWMAAVESP